MLYLETDLEGDEVYVHLDADGVVLLRRTLDSLEAEPKQPEHDHLFTEAWGGHELEAELTPGRRDAGQEANRAVGHVKLYYWPRV